jgi:hypothetical protein
MLLSTALVLATSTSIVSISTLGYCDLISEETVERELGLRSVSARRWIPERANARAVARPIPRDFIVSSLFLYLQMYVPEPAPVRKAVPVNNGAAIFCFSSSEFSLIDLRFTFKKRQ